MISLRTFLALPIHAAPDRRRGDRSDKGPKRESWFSSSRTERRLPNA